MLMNSLRCMTNQRAFRLRSGCQIIGINFTRCWLTHRRRHMCFWVKTLRPKQEG